MHQGFHRKLRDPRDRSATSSSVQCRCGANSTGTTSSDLISNFPSLKRRTWFSKIENHSERGENFPFYFWSSHPRYLQEKSGGERRLLAIGCPAADLQAAMDGSTTCTVEPIARTDRGSYAGQETSFGDFLVVGACAGCSVHQLFN